MIDQGLNFNIFNIIILIGIFQGPIFALIVFFNKNYRFLANYFLVSTALALSFNNFQYWLLDTGMVNELYFQIPFEFLIMSMFYPFVDEYLQIKSPKKIILAIIVPFFTSFIFRLIMKFGLITLSNDLIHILLTLEEYLSLVFSVSMITIILIKIHKYEKAKTDFNLSEIKAKTKWLKQALVFGIIICVFWVFVIQDNIARFEDDLSKYYPLWIIISILVYWIVYKGIIETQIFNQRIEIRNDTIEFTYNGQKTAYINDDFFLEIKSFIINEKLYLNPNLNLDLVAEKFNVSIGHLSKTVNKNANQSFTDFVNQLRVNESKKMLLNPNYKNYTIEAIGYESGFYSKSNFYAAFKKETNQTPSAFRLRK
ncbi:hypothetical protein ATO12_11040 [Aquimarina atlantica]|uniref:HTH araC/xylS-type domain-containing protein n=1 Tax=Aquimarina atlantica TaxID=1317122 RepID=A0A023BMJ6_9FLAO|nr:helix-turn-helix domain-containing protein [Aquimarina atlantica]EZH71290.1 hypothetical protein ATO12_11040 [Aquimarina atlantica]